MVEFNLRMGNTNWNTAKTVEILRSADVQGLDIIVFPEGCLNDPKDPIPAPNVNSTLSVCQDNRAHRSIRDISCAVQSSHVYTVINIMMKSPCTEEDPCTSLQTYLVFNTAIVFDRNGAIIAK